MSIDLKLVCPLCFEAGCVVVDAMGRWDVATQAWVIDTYQPQNCTVCTECGGDVDLDDCWKPLIDPPEKGAASIKITLDDGAITVTHGDCDALLADKPRANQGDWTRLIEAIKSVGIEWHPE